MTEAPTVETREQLLALDPDTTTTLRVLAQEFDIAGIERLANLKELRLQVLALASWAPLSTLTDLRSLHLVACHSDLTPLRGLSALNVLSLVGEVMITDSGSLVRDLDPLAGMTELVELSLAENGCITNVDALRSMAKLRSLNLSNCFRLGDLSGLAGLAAIETLDLSCCDSVADISPLATLASLRTLSLDGCKRIESVAPLAALTHLKEISARECEKVTDWEVLEASAPHLVR